MFWVLINLIIRINLVDTRIWFSKTKDRISKILYSKNSVFSKEYDDIKKSILIRVVVTVFRFWTGVLRNAHLTIYYLLIMYSTSTRAQAMCGRSDTCRSLVNFILQIKK